jgi:nifR3 family TIM-barrel protein
MAGYTDSAFRRLCLSYGASAAVTEMVSVAGLSRKSAGTCRYLERSDAEHPLGVQLYGSRPDDFASAAALVSAMGFDFIDINAGCPVKKVVRSCSGASLLRDLPRLCEIVERTAGASGRLPVTVKIRLGWSPEEPVPVEIGTILARSGARALTVHGRYRSDQFSGRVDMDALRRIVEASSIPVIANGESGSLAAIHDLRTDSGAAGVMIGRGAIGRPWVFRALLGSGPCHPLPGELSVTIVRHLAMMKETIPAPFVYHVLRGHLVNYLRGFRGASELRARAVSVESDGDVAAICRIAEELAEAGNET